ncbi:DUF1262 family protein [Quillaja saponaria]|uniref:DUF1262 family protein n=1 Tax=Quillaja saponaria TaxID=32244 RepID=A0AAD7PFU0_QUISA|nr:DUF1262 family protein [Quillaja saponaria]
MYVTRPMSMYRKCPEALSLDPPEGPNSGILVIQDEEIQPTSCLGLCKRDELKDLPFPQNKNLELYYRAGLSLNRTTHYHHVAFIPVLDQPLSSNRYYVIQQYGKHRGEAYTNLKEEDIGTCCLFNCVYDESTQPLDTTNIHQQFEMCLRGRTINLRDGFSAKSTSPDGFPPKFLSRKWKVCSSAAVDTELGEALGLDNALRACHPEFNFPLANKSSKAVIVGKWYCPLMFVKEGTWRTLKDEMRRPMYYEMTLEQNWEQIFSCENNSGVGNTVVVDADVQIEMVVTDGREAVHDWNKDLADGLLWFRSCNNHGEETSVGLSSAIVERMKWEQERVGWIGGMEKQARVNRVEEFEGTNNGWKKFGCYVLVERFVLKRLDGSLVLTYDFRHTHHIKGKWE